MTPFIGGSATTRGYKVVCGQFSGSGFDLIIAYQFSDGKGLDELFNVDLDNLGRADGSDLLSWAAL